MDVERHILLLCVSYVQQICSDGPFGCICAEVQNHHSKYGQHDAYRLLVGHVSYSQTWHTRTHTRSKWRHKNQSTHEKPEKGKTSCYCRKSILLLWDKRIIWRKPLVFIADSHYYRTTTHYYEEKQLIITKKSVSLLWQNILLVWEKHLIITKEISLLGGKHITTSWEKKKTDHCYKKSCCNKNSILLLLENILLFWKKKKKTNITDGIFFNIVFMVTTWYRSHILTEWIK